MRLFRSKNRVDVSVTLFLAAQYHAYIQCSFGIIFFQLDNIEQTIHKFRPTPIVISWLYTQQCDNGRQYKCPEKRGNKQI